MEILSDIWNAAKAIGKGVAQVFVGICEVLILTVYAIGYVLFSIVDHLYAWIDSVIEKIGNIIRNTILIDPKATEEFLSSLPQDKKTVLPPYTPGVKRTLMIATDEEGKVRYAQVASTEKGFDEQIEEAFKQGHIVEQPIIV